MSKANSLSDLITGIATAIQIEGFRRKGQALFTEQHGNWGIINFQQDPRRKTATTIGFTVEVGTASSRLLEFFKGVDFFHKGLPPSVAECQYRIRLGYLIPELMTDQWWDLKVDGSSNCSLQADLISKIQQFALLAIRLNLSDSQLRDRWLEEYSEWGVDVGHQILRFLAVLLADLGPRHKLLEVLEALEKGFASKITNCDIAGFCALLRQLSPQDRLPERLPPYPQCQ